EKVWRKTSIRVSNTSRSIENIALSFQLRNRSNDKQREELYIGTAESEHIEMYLKAIWYISERREEIKVSSIAKLLNVTQPSVVQMLQGGLDNDNLVKYRKGNVVEMTTHGEKIGKQMIRNTRLLEVMMKDSLKIAIDEEMVCGIEHHMKTIFTDALCTLLKHPRKCPHLHSILMGKWCKR
ncbi:MAG: metal-dependent transcriptional regulator, partial [Nitrososphaeraceae archaeon]